MKGMSSPAAVASGRLWQGPATTTTPMSPADADSADAPAGVLAEASG